MSAETIVNMAETAWKIIESGAPSAEITTATANAVPQVDDWQSLTNAVGPMWVSRRRKIRFKWPLDDYLHVDVTMVLKWDYGARYHGGGAYIPNVWVEVPECFVGWPWDVNVNLTARNPTNANGSGEPPLARLPVTLSGTIASPGESYTVQYGFELFGDGNYE
jgi:hypothetical protein